MLTEVPPWMGELQDAARRAGAVASRVDILSGVPADRLAERAGGARMLVLGSYGDGANSGMLAGSLALELLDRVTRPVAVVRGSAPQVPPPGSGPVVVGVDVPRPDAPRSSSPPAWPTPGPRRWSPCTPGPMSSPGSMAPSAAPRPRRRSRRRPAPSWRPSSTPWPGHIPICRYSGSGSTAHPFGLCSPAPTPRGYSSSGIGATPIPACCTAPPAGPWWSSRRVRSW
jgi:hypothetical protein